MVNGVLNAPVTKQEPAGIGDEATKGLGTVVAPAGDWPVVTPLIVSIPQYPCNLFALTAGTNITFSSGTTYNGSAAITINATVPAQVYPSAGIANSTGSAWGTSYSTSGSGTVVALANSPSFTTPALGVATGTSVQVTGGFYSTSSSSFTYTDGIVVDYITGTGRFSVGTGDGYAWYNAGVATTSLMTLSSAGALTAISTISAPQVNASNGIIVSNKTVSTSFSIPSGSNAHSVGPVTVSSGVNVTVPTGSRWVVL